MKLNFVQSVYDCKNTIPLKIFQCVTVINAYTPTSSDEDEKVEQLYDGIERAMADSYSKYQIITGDFNAKIGSKTKEEDLKSMGAFGIGERNERGDCLIEFAE